MAKLRITWRILRLSEHLLTGALISIFLGTLLTAGMQLPRLPHIVQWWHRRACRILNLTVVVQGQPLEHTRLLVANHISWLDIPAIGALQPVCFLSKSEVRNWPLIGWMSVIAGTLFIERGKNQSSRIAGSIRERLDHARSVLFFPEGTTTDGSEVRRFHPRLFGAAHDAGVPLQPVAVRYPVTPGRPAVAPFIDDDPFPDHALRVLAEPEIKVEIQFLTATDSQGIERKALARETRQAIRDALHLPPETSNNVG